MTDVGSFGFRPLPLGRRIVDHRQQAIGQRLTPPFLLSVLFLPIGFSSNILGLPFHAEMRGWISIPLLRMLFQSK